MTDRNTHERVLTYRLRGYSPERLAELFEVPLGAVRHIYDHAAAVERSIRIGASADSGPGRASPGVSSLLDSPGALASGAFLPHRGPNHGG